MATSLLTPTNRLFRNTTLSDSATTTISAATTDIADWTIGGNRTLDTPGTGRHGQLLTVRITQDATGSRLVTWHAIYTFPGGFYPTLSTTAGSTDVFLFQYSSATSKWECISILIKDISGPESITYRLGANSSNVNASTTLVDSGIEFPVLAGLRYIIEGNIKYSSGATPDIKFALTPSAGTLTGKWGMKGLGPGASSPGVTEQAWLDVFGDSNVFQLGGDSFLQMAAQIEGSFTPSTAATIKLRFAQNTSNASNTFVAADSWIRVRVVGSSLPGAMLGLSPLTGVVVGRNLRTTDFGSFTSNTRVLSVRAPVRNGRTYMVSVTGEVVLGVGTTDTTIQTELRITTDDTEPTTSSTQIGRGLNPISNDAGIPDPVHIAVPYVCTHDGWLRVAACSQRAVGSLDCFWTCASDRPMTLTIIDLGPTVSTSGTVY